MKTWKDIVKTKAEIESQGYKIDNNMIDGFDIYVTAHFGNIPSLNMVLQNCCLFSGYNLKYTIGDVLKTIVEVLDLSEEDGLSLNHTKDIPIRIVSNGTFTKVVGFGHFMKDRFVFIEDIIKMALENVKEEIKND